MMLNERVQGLTKPARAKSGCAYRHRALLTRTGRTLRSTGLSLEVAADLLGVSAPTLCRWIAVDLRAERAAAKKERGAAK